MFRQGFQVKGWSHNFCVLWRSRGKSRKRFLATEESNVWATSITLHKASKELEVEFNTGERFRYPASLLRMQSPAAGPQPKQGTRRHVGIIAVEPVGRYAVQLQFDDLHGTGIFTWKYLYNLRPKAPTQS